MKTSDDVVLSLHATDVRVATYTRPSDTRYARKVCADNVAVSRFPSLSSPHRSTLRRDPTRVSAVAMSRVLSCTVGFRPRRYGFGTRYCRAHASLFSRSSDTKSNGRRPATTSLRPASWRSNLVTTKPIRPTRYAFFSATSTVVCSRSRVHVIHVYVGSCCTSIIPLRFKIVSEFLFNSRRQLGPRYFSTSRYYITITVIIITVQQTVNFQGTFKSTLEVYENGHCFKSLSINVVYTYIHI